MVYHRKYTSQFPSCGGGDHRRWWGGCYKNRSSFLPPPPLRGPPPPWGGITAGTDFLCIRVLPEHKGTAFMFRFIFAAQRHNKMSCHVSLFILKFSACPSLSGKKLKDYIPIIFPIRPNVIRNIMLSFLPLVIPPQMPLAIPLLWRGGPPQVVGRVLQKPKFVFTPSTASRSPAPMGRNYRGMTTRSSPLERGGAKRRGVQAERPPPPSGTPPREENFNFSHAYAWGAQRAGWFTAAGALF